MQRWWGLPVEPKSCHGISLTNGLRLSPRQGQTVGTREGGGTVDGTVRQAKQYFLHLFSCLLGLAHSNPSKSCWLNHAIRCQVDMFVSLLPLPGLQQQQERVRPVVGSIDPLVLIAAAAAAAAAALTAPATRVAARAASISLCRCSRRCASNAALATHCAGWLHSLMRCWGAHMGMISTSPSAYSTV